MSPLTVSQRLVTVGWNFVLRLLFVVAVVFVALLLGVSTLASLVIVSSAIFILSTANLLSSWRAEDGRPPGDPVGDRSPLRPSPIRPSASVKRPLPGTGAMSFISRLFRRIVGLIPKRYPGGRLDRLGDETQRDVLANHSRSGF